MVTGFEIAVVHVFLHEVCVRLSGMAGGSVGLVDNALHPVTEPARERKGGNEEILEAVRKHEPAGTQEVADEVGTARQSADYRLRQLKESGQVSKKKVGRSLVWSTTDG